MPSSQALAPPLEPAAATEVCRATGLAYRTLDYWCRTGVLGPRLARERPGSGYSRTFEREELRVLTRVLQLRAGGLGEEVLAAARQGRLDYLVDRVHATTGEDRLARGRRGT